ncbi:MAG: FAD:protein FMN transferase [Deltaproteobacteria bacterium]|nr:FAD:protein FMN transferase [Deltaproteobacteria bacterium]
MCTLHCSARAQKLFVMLAFPLLSTFSSASQAGEGQAPTSATEAKHDVKNAKAALRLRIIRRDRVAFGTQIQILATANTDVEARLVAAHLDAAFAELSRVDTLLDDKKAISDLGRINSAAGLAPVAVDPEVFALLLESERLSKLTSGAFDPTFAALSGVWRFSADDVPAPSLPAVDAGTGNDAGTPAKKELSNVAPAVPSDALIAYYREFVSHHDLLLEPSSRTAWLKRKGMRLSLGGVRKGYALDLAARKLESLGVQDFIVSAGGDIVIRGKKGNHPWKVGIQDPRAQGYFAALSASTGSVMTTGDYERFFFADDVRYHHVIDPRTGRPARGLRSVTVLAKDALVADAFSTAVFVLGPKDGMAMVERMKDVEAILVTDKNEVLVSTGLKKSVDFRPPTDAP